MPGPSELSDLYEAVFGTLPSHASQITLRRMQEFLKLKSGDPFSRMLIVQLRSADQIEETRLEIQTLVQELTPLLATARTLVDELDRASGDLARRNRRIPAMERVTEVFDGRAALPMFAYLACAFQWPRSYDDLHVRERRGAARFDLFLLASVLGLAMLLGAAFYRLGISLPR